jgi:hypothetical protein
MVDPNHPGHLRNWPRDGPIRWRAVAGAIIRTAVSLAAILAHLALAFIYLALIVYRAIGPATAWVLAVGWVVLAAWLVQAWWFDRRRIVLPPLLAAALLGLSLGATALSGHHF